MQENRQEFGGLDFLYTHNFPYIFLKMTGRQAVVEDC